MVISRSEPSTGRHPVFLMVGQVTRGEFFAGLLILGCVNGFVSRIIPSVNHLGWADALFNTFEISFIVWISCAAGIYLMLGVRKGEVRSLDLALGVGFLFLVILPIGSLSWLAVTALCCYVIVSTNVISSRRGAVILLSITVPMLWSRLLFQFFANLILEADASLVSWLLGTDRTGTLVEFANSSGYLVILPACSSLANVSLALLCWVTVSQLVGHKRSAYDVFWCLLVCASVIAMNVTRVSMMGLSQWHYEAIHSPWGDAIANIII